ncbi:MAG TPA: glycosyltransferase family 2 protein [Leclercia adecarboxylata]|nr:glycosyltransferase family 2 protein [Leclercia adecarboxylata]
MVYVIVLNWNGAKDTCLCVNSLLQMNYDKFRIVIVDNKSTDDSYTTIKNEVINKVSDNSQATIITSEDINKHKVKPDEKIIYIQSDYNRGYAGGNNLGVKFALNQDDADYVWVLNNDTEVDANALQYLVDKCNQDSNIGICGSRLVYFDDRETQQGLGGLHNKWLCTTKQYGIGESAHAKYNDEIVAQQIDYVIGAAMFFTKECLNKIGLMYEDYFLYYEELDICLRARKANFKLGICSDSIVYHKEGASTGGGKSKVADFCSIRNRLLVTAKFYPECYITVWLSLFGVAFNRARRKEFNKMIVCLLIIFSFGRKKLQHGK